jgi:hypothetical protein
MIEARVRAASAAERRGMTHASLPIDRSLLT